MDETTAPTATNWRFKKRFLLYIILFLCLAFVAYAWIERNSIVDEALRDQLNEYDVTADYEILEIGPRFQRLRNVVIGNPENPDFTAKEVDIDVEINFAGAILRNITVRGARLNGRYNEGALSFGELDKFLESDSEEPAELPDIALDIADSVMRLETPWGVVGASLIGQGHLQSNFKGNVALHSKGLTFDDCQMDIANFDGKVQISDKQPHISGKFTNDFINCKAGPSMRNAVIDTNIKLSQHFNHWRGDLNIGFDEARLNENTIAKLQSNINIDGDIDRTHIQYGVKRGAILNDNIRLASINAKGEGRLSFANEAFNASVTGDASWADGSFKQSTIRTIHAFKSSEDSSPVAPVLNLFSDALGQAATRFSGAMRYDIAVGETINNRNNILIDNIVLQSQSGGKLLVNREIEFSKAVDSGDASVWALQSPIDIALSGGKLPNLTASIMQSNAGWVGKVDIPTYKTSNADLTVKALEFDGKVGGIWNFTGLANLSGPLPSGRIEGLAIPVEGKWNPKSGLSLYERCQSVAFTSLQLSDLRLAKQSTQICPQGNRAIVQSNRNGDIDVFAKTLALKVDGKIGDSPISIRSENLLFSLSDGVHANDVAVAIGEKDNQTNFNMKQLTAEIGGQFILGKAYEGSANIGSVPLEMDSADLNWRFEDGVLFVDGALMVRDAEQVARFEPVKVPDLLLTLDNGEISALAQVQEPSSGRKLADVDILHLLSSTSGRALFSVDNLLFDNEVQPETLTNIALGVVANVQGAIDGDGRIQWDGNNVTSGGKFSTENMDLAAAFGPVSGLSGEIILTDLINFESEDRQILQLGSVNTGIEVFEGRISYQLLPGQKVEIHGGSWPFAGGRLILEPTVWDLGQEVARELAFEVIGMDAGKFLQQFDFDNIAATGEFYGRLPMVFDADGGHIVGGNLKSFSGGNVAYVGELSYEDLGVFGNFAFNALKSLDYQELEIGMNGDIDGKITTVVNLSGLKQGTDIKRNFITKQLAKIPLEFNVTIEAQFTELLNTVRGYYDPNLLIETYRPDLIRSQNNNKNQNSEDNVKSGETEQPVQPLESKDSP